MKDQVVLATGRTPVALRYNGQDLNDVYQQLPSANGGNSVGEIGAKMGWPSPVIPLDVDLGGYQKSDPIITGFDGSV